MLSEYQYCWNLELFLFMTSLEHVGTIKFHDGHVNFLAATVVCTNYVDK